MTSDLVKFDPLGSKIRWDSKPVKERLDATNRANRDAAQGVPSHKAVYLAIGISCAGRKEVLGLWIEQTEGAKFWLSVMNELKARFVPAPATPRLGSRQPASRVLRCASALRAARADPRRIGWPWP